MYLQGDGMKSDTTKAIELLSYAHEQGNIPSGCYLSEAYMKAETNTSYIAAGLMKGLQQHIPYCQKVFKHYQSYTHF